jgi:aspartate 1-decarboxylase
MFTTLLKSKIHRARVTEADLHYEGSCAIDSGLMKAANIVPHEHIHIWNVTNGNRFETYAIPAPKGSGTIQINGAAAHHAKPGDIIIISSFAHYPKNKIAKHKPTVVFVDDDNRMTTLARKSGKAGKPSH